MLNIYWSPTLLDEGWGKSYDIGAKENIYGEGWKSMHVVSEKEKRKEKKSLKDRLGGHY